LTAFIGTCDIKSDFTLAIFTQMEGSRYHSHIINVNIDQEKPYFGSERSHFFHFSRWN